MKIRQALAICTVAGGLASAAQAADAPPNPREALQLGRQIASTAQTAEKGASAESVQATVTAALQALIVSSGADPRLVVMALQDTVAACRGGIERTWTCPTSAGSYQALQSLQDLVVAQLDQTGVAAIGTVGPAAFGSVPLTSPGGASYVAP